MTSIKKQTIHNSRPSDEVVKAKRDHDAWRLLCFLVTADIGTANWLKLTVIDIDTRFTFPLRQRQVLRELINGVSDNSYVVIDLYVLYFFIPCRINNDGIMRHN